MRDDVVQFRFQVTPNRVGNLLEPGRASNSNFGGRTHVSTRKDRDEVVRSDVAGWPRPLAFSPHAGSHRLPA